MSDSFVDLMVRRRTALEELFPDVNELDLNGTPLLAVWWCPSSSCIRHSSVGNKRHLHRQMRILSHSLRHKWACLCRVADSHFGGRAYYGFSVVWFDFDGIIDSRVVDPLSLVLFGVRTAGTTYWFPSRKVRDSVASWTSGETWPPSSEPSLEDVYALLNDD